MKLKQTRKALSAKLHGITIMIIVELTRYVIIVGKCCAVVTLEAWAAFDSANLAWIRGI